MCWYAILTVCAVVVRVRVCVNTHMQILTLCNVGCVAIVIQCSRSRLDQCNVVLVCVTSRSCVYCSTITCSSQRLQQRFPPSSALLSSTSVCISSVSLISCLTCFLCPTTYLVVWFPHSPLRLPAFVIVPLSFNSRIFLPASIVVCCSLTTCNVIALGARASDCVTSAQ